MLIQEYLQNKFESGQSLPYNKYPLNMIPNIKTIEHINDTADLRKTTGYDYIPYTAMKYP